MGALNIPSLQHFELQSRPSYMIKKNIPILIPTKFPPFRLSGANCSHNIICQSTKVERDWCCLCQEGEFADSTTHPNTGAKFGARIGRVLLQVSIPRNPSQTIQPTIRLSFNYFNFIVIHDFKSLDTLAIHAIPRMTSPKKPFLTIKITVIQLCVFLLSSNSSNDSSDL